MGTVEFVLCEGRNEDWNSALNRATFAPYFLPITTEFLIKTICRDPVLHLVLGVLIADEMKKRNLDKYASEPFFQKVF